MNNNEIKSSPKFKVQTTKVVIFIIFFVLIYLLLLLLASSLTVFCVYGGIKLILLYMRFYTILIGVGLASMGILILVFLLKFIFTSHKIDRSHLFEIKRQDEPKLFSLIDEIVLEVDTHFPKRVYLSQNVNASVFYNSSFWSMFFPIKKNLQIGLGLVNTLTKSELKAVLSHEFGHFSQKTMRVGSYMYNVNQIIFNMLYDNDSYKKLTQSLADINGFITFFVIIAVRIVMAIQWILRKYYNVMNKSYMSLSREMEFHADEVAAHVTGIDPLKSSLLRMSLADSSFDAVLGFYQEHIKNGYKSENIYREQLFVLQFLARYNNIPLANCFPEISIEELNRLNKSKLIIKDQWASHPSIEERIERLDKLNIRSIEKEHAPANNYFEEIEQTQKKLTQNLFENVEYQQESQIISLGQFQKEYKEQFEKNIFSKIYNGYYDHKNPVLFEIETVPSPQEGISFDDLFSEQKVEMVYYALALQNDIKLLEQIADKSLPIKTFDYDGRRYKRKESKKLLQELKNEWEQLNEDIKQNDIKIFQFFKKQEQDKLHTSHIEDEYRAFFKFDAIYDSEYGIYADLLQKLQFMEMETSYDEIKANFKAIEPLEEKMKDAIKNFLSEDDFSEEIDGEVKEILELYISQKWKYFGEQSYFQENLNILFSAIHHCAYLLSRKYFLLKKRLLDYQEKLITDENTNY